MRASPSSRRETANLRLFAYSKRVTRWPGNSSTRHEFLSSIATGIKSGVTGCTKHLKPIGCHAGSLEKIQVTAKYAKRLFSIFRDREELRVSADLGTNINEALRQSRYLIVICSPDAAQSRWVGQEIVEFKKLEREDRILALIVAGEPNASDGKPGSRQGMSVFPNPCAINWRPTAICRHSLPSRLPRTCVKIKTAKPMQS